MDRKIRNETLHELMEDLFIVEIMGPGYEEELLNTLKEEDDL